ncbi:hypothetical protein B9Z55_022393 [Caenorhabditis nigoni]|nr:hypothetical protein B9Z55_022393 [Caenorhabditis nigoni]
MFVDKERVRRTAKQPLNVVKVALHLTKKKEMKTVKGQNRLVNRLNEIVRMDGQYVKKEETVDSMIQLLEIHEMIGKNYDSGRSNYHIWFPGK